MVETIQQLTGNDLQNRRGIIGLVLVVALVVIPLTSDYNAYIWARYLVYGLLGLSLGFIWGYAGIMSFGQAAFFGLGGYLLAWSMKYLPEAISTYAGFVGAIVVPAGIALFLGWFLFYSGVKDLYFVIITLALSVILEQLATSSGIFSEIFGGVGGLYLSSISLGIPGVIMVPIQDNLILYYLVLAVIIVAFLLARRVVKSEFGDVMLAIRENEERAQSLGYNTTWYKMVSFGLSAAFAGVAGALYASLAGLITPGSLGFLLSTEVVIWVVIGGRFYLSGAIFGPILVNYLHSNLSTYIGNIYMLLMGAIFIAIVLFFKEGVVGFFDQLLSKYRIGGDS